MVTVLIFFLFFRSSDPQPKIEEGVSATMSVAELETRILAIETALEKLQTENSAGGDPGGVIADALNPLHQTVSRIENTVTVKFDSLTERMGKLEQQMAEPEKKSGTAQPVAKVSPPAEPSKPAAATAKKQWPNLL